MTYADELNAEWQATMAEQMLAEQRKTNELLAEIAQLLRPLADLKVPKFLR